MLITAFVFGMLCGASGLVVGFIVFGHFAFSHMDW